MRMKYALLALSCLLTAGMSAQVTTEPEEVDPNAEVKIIVDISKLDATKEHVQNLQTDAAAGLDLYIWTWSPNEHADGHPLANGVGAAAWKNSNEALKMTKEAENIYSYTMTPVDFYEVDAATVYTKDIMFLVKPKDGGGFGDPDRKSDDLTILVDPPNVIRNPAFIFPNVVTEDDLVTLIYENGKEDKVSMQNLDPADCYVYSAATLSDSSTVIIENFFSVGTNPELQMDYIGDNTFRKFIYPRAFFNVPQGLSITKLSFVIMRQQFLSGDDRLDYTLEVSTVCE